MRDAPSRHVVGLVRSVGNGGAEAEQAWVRCPRSVESVPLDKCEHCKLCVNIQRDRVGRPTSVLCRVDPPMRTERAGHTLELSRLSVGSIMTRNVLCVRPDLSLDTVTELFVESGYKAVPVVDETGSPLGIVTEADVLLDTYARGGACDAVPSRDIELSGERLHLVPQARTVGDVMMPIALTLLESTPFTQAAAVMAFEGLYHVTIMSSQGQVVGILAASDILHHVARADGYILPPQQRGI